MITLGDGTPYKEKMTIWQWVFMPTSLPIIQSYENTKSHLWWDGRIILDDETASNANDLFGSREAAIKDLEVFMKEIEQGYIARIARMIEDADNLQKWLLSSNQELLRLKGIKNDF